MSDPLNPKHEKNWPGIIICVLMFLSLGVLYMIAKTHMELEAAAQKINLPISKEARKD